LESAGGVKEVDQRIGEVLLVAIQPLPNNGGPGGGAGGLEIERKIEIGVSWVVAQTVVGNWTAGLVFSSESNVR